MGVSINKVVNANVYIDGANYLGRADEVTLPDVQPGTIEHKALGMVGTVPIPAGLQAMSAKIKWNGIYPEVLKASMSVYTTKRIQVRGNVEVFEGGNRVREDALVAYMTVTSKKAGGPNFKPNENADTESEFNVSTFKLEVGGVEICDIDVNNNIWRVAGVDQLAGMRANIGA